MEYRLAKATITLLVLAAVLWAGYMTFPLSKAQGATLSACSTLVRASGHNPKDVNCACVQRKVSAGRYGMYYSRLLNISASSGEVAAKNQARKYALMLGAKWPDWGIRAKVRISAAFYTCAR
jgi:uncharacterized protein (DUF2237 family)